MPKQGENIYRRKDGRWEGKYVKERLDGKIRYGYVSGSSYNEVFNRKKEMVRKLSEKHGDRKLVVSNVSEVSARWLQSVDGILKETTYVKYNSILKNYILPEFGERKVSSLTRDEIRMWMENLHKSGGRNGTGLSAKMVNSVVSVLRLLCRYAREYCGLSTDNFDEISLRQEKSPIEILSRREQKRLEIYLMENMDLSNLGILYCLYTGVRLGELCALRWRDLKRSDGVLDIHATMERVKAEVGSRYKTKIVITSPKSNSSIRLIPIPNRLLELVCDKQYPDNAFFLTGDQEMYVDPRTMENRFRVVLKKSGIDPVKFHALRHTFATRCIEKGFDVKSLSEILGHANVTITMNRYVHPTMVQKKDYMNRL